MKRKSRRCSTGHGTGTIQAKRISPARRMGALAVQLSVDEGAGPDLRYPAPTPLPLVHADDLHAMTAHMRNELFRLYT